MLHGNDWGWEVTHISVSDEKVSVAMKLLDISPKTLDLGLARLSFGGSINIILERI